MTTLWTAPLEDLVEGPLAADEKRIFVTTRDGTLFALDRETGAPVWKVAGRAGLLASGPTALVLRQADGTVFRLDPESGAVMWRVNSAVSGGLAPLVDGDRILVAGNGLAALDAQTGSVLWSVAGGTAASSLPEVFGGRLLVGEQDGTLRCRDRATGVSLWTFRTTSALLAPPRVGGARRVFLGTTDRRVVALSLEKGQLAWRWKVGADVQSAPALQGNLVLVAPFDAVLYAINRSNGNLAWRAPLPSRPLSSPMPVGTTVLVACHENEILGFDLKTGTRHGGLKTTAQIRTPPLLLDGRLYVGLRNRSVVALKLAGEGEPAPASPSPSPSPSSSPSSSPSPSPSKP
jgi:outer membrane protein assembly factor BamB